jgi:predicted NBD/HSP70 family sugar kinase
VTAARQNRAAVLEAVQRAGSISRPRLVESTGLTAATISNVVRDLIEWRLVRTTGELAPRRKSAAGAPSPLLGLDSSWHRVLSVHQGVSRILLGGHDLAGRLLVSSDLPGIRDERPDALVGRIVERLRSLVLQQGWDEDQVRGVGVGAVGLVDPETGGVRAAPNLGWIDVPLREQLQSELPWPVTVRNNVHAMAIGECRFAGVPERQAVYVYVGTGIGSGIIADGRVEGGAHGAAGELGHLLVPGGGKCTCGKTGCLETVAAEPAIALRAEIEGPPKPAVDRVVKLAVAGDAGALRLLHDVGESLGLAMAQVTEILDPGAIIVNGIATEAADAFLAPLAEALTRNTFAARGRQVAVRTATFGRQAGMLGAAALALEAFVYSPEAEFFADRRARAVWGS